MPIQGLKISLIIGLIWLVLFIAGFMILGLFYIIKRLVTGYCKMRYLTLPGKPDNILNKILEAKKMKRILLWLLCILVILLLAIKLFGCSPAMAQTPVYDIRVPDSTAIKKLDGIKLNAVLDSLHRYDLGDWVKKTAYDQLAAEHKKLLDLNVKHLGENLQLLEPGILRAWQIVNDTNFVIVPKSSLPKAKAKAKGK